jgi:hypothetical protein
VGDARCTLLGEAPPTAACLQAAGFHPGDDGAWHGDGLLVRLTPAAPAEAQATAEGLASFLHSRGASPAVVAAVGAARVVVGLVAAPGPAPALEALLPALAAEMRGHVLVGEALFDGAGLRVFPAPPPLPPLPAGPGDVPGDAQSTAGVWRRAMALAAVAARGPLETHPRGRAEPFRQQVVRWLAAADLGPALAPPERDALLTPVGALSPPAQIAASWRCEGLTVLGWALGAWELPAPDVQVHPARLAAQLGFLRVATPPPHLALRPPDALRAAARAQAAIAWRLQHPGPVDFAPVAAAAGAPGLCGPDGDLPLQGAPAAAAAPALFATCRSVAAERHHAFAWLIGARALYHD